jgi:hypothetical protein
VGLWLYWRLKKAAIPPPARPIVLNAASFLNESYAGTMNI